MILIAIMTFVLISSSGTMVLAVNYGYRKDRKMTFIFLILTAILGATFVGMQAFEWSKLIFEEGIRPWGNPLGAAQFGATLLHDHRLSRHARVDRRDLPHHRGGQGAAGRPRYAERPGFLTGRKGNYEMVETMGLYWHFVDLVWVFIFAVFYLW